MAQQALYRKWRSQTFNEIIGQEHVTRTLQNALRAGRTSHAYLFTGPRGTGKTSTARILAKAVNCRARLDERPCNECHMCVSITEGTALDLIEIDAASNTSVDDVRDLREKVNFSPSEGRYKVYIIDEVHMLSNSAFNALLKTLEEPPEHVVFVLATTEVHRVPATVLSRCQRFDFHRIAVDKMVAHMADILDAERIEYERDALETLAWQATGSLRDALSLLDQLIASGGADLTITVALAREILGLPDSESVAALVDALLARDTGRGLSVINTVLEQGTDARQFLVAVLDYLRALLLVTVGGTDQLHNLPTEFVERLQTQSRSVRPSALVNVIRAFHGAGSDLKLGLQPQLPLELAFVEAVLELPAESPNGAQQRSAPAQQERRDTTSSTSPSTNETSVRQESTTDEERTNEAPAASEQRRPPRSTSSPTTTDETEETGDETEEGTSRDTTGQHDLAWWQAEWDNFLAWLQTRGPQGKRLAIRLKFGQPHALNDGTLTLRFAYSIHKDKVEEQETRSLVRRALKAYGDEPLGVDCVWLPEQENSAPTKTKYEKAAEDPVVREAMRLGGRIVDVRVPKADDS